MALDFSMSCNIWMVLYQEKPIYRTLTMTWQSTVLTTRERDGRTWRYFGLTQFTGKHFFQGLRSTGRYISWQWTKRSFIGQFSGPKIGFALCGSVFKSLYTNNKWRNDLVIQTLPCFNTVFVWKIVFSFNYW